MTERFRIEKLEKSMLIYEDETYLGEITLFSKGIIDRLNELYNEIDSYENLLNQYRKTNDYLVTLLAEAVKQGFKVDTNQVVNEISNLKEEEKNKIIIDNKEYIFNDVDYDKIDDISNYVQLLNEYVEPFLDFSLEKFTVLTKSVKFFRLFS